EILVVGLDQIVGGRHRAGHRSRWRGQIPSQRRSGTEAPAAASGPGSADVTNGSPTTGSLARRWIVSRLDRTIASGSSGQGVITIPATRSPAATATCTVSSVWLILPRP